MLSSAWAGTGRVLQEVTSSPHPPWGRVSAGSGDTREKAFENGAHSAGGQRRKTRGRGAPPGSFVLRWEERFDPVQSIHPWKSQKANNRRQTHTDTYTHAQTQTHTHAHTDAHRHTRAQTCADAHTQDGKRPQASLPYCRGGGWAGRASCPGQAPGGRLAASWDAGEQCWGFSLPKAGAPVGPCTMPGGNRNYTGN